MAGFTNKGITSYAGGSQGMYLKAIMNALTPEAIDTDLVTEDDFSGETINNIREAFSNTDTYKNMKVGETKVINTSEYKDRMKSEGGFFDSKRTTEFLAGSATITKTDSGFRMQDMYDTGSPSSDGVTIEDNGWKHYAAKAVGWFYSPENPDGSSKDPKSSNTIELDLFVPNITSEK